MKLPFTLRLFIPAILFFTCIFENAYCSHQVGGEITWTCQGNGTYKFKYTFYNDCFGIFPANMAYLQTNIPGIQNIILNLTQTSSLSTPGFQSGGINACISCDSITGAQPAPGYFGEFIYESDTVHLPGLPPTSGWWFRVSDCCRAYSVTNLPNSSSLYMACRAVMYPYNGRIPGECSDNSPFFVEKPQAKYCTGRKTSYSYAVEDLDRDELQYSWALPIDDSGNNINYGPGYTVTSPFPGPTLNPANSPITLNARTGLVEFTSFTGGIFTSVGKVTSYKCGQKVSEIFRDMTTILNNNCPSIFATQPNHIPNINAPFIDLTTGLQTSYIDTVSPGDTVVITFTATDYDVFTNGLVQQLTMEGYSVQFGNNFTDPNVGCLSPPCAYLNTSLPFTNPASLFVGFNWPITCAHVYDDSTCTGNYTTYRFWLRLRDNYCLANGAVSIPFLVVVAGAAITNDTSATTVCLTSSPVPLTATPTGGTWSGTGVSGTFFDPALAGAGIHEVLYTVTDSSGCQSSDKITFTVNTCTGINESVINNQVALMQDPASGIVTVAFKDQHQFSELQLYDTNGRKLQAYSIAGASEKKIPINSFQPGIYLIRIIGKNGFLNEKLVRF